MALNEHVGLDDALRVLIVFAERRGARYERAATRFAGRVMLGRRLGLAEARQLSTENRGRQSSRASSALPVPWISAIGALLPQHGCGSGTDSDRAPADARRSSPASALDAASRRSLQRADASQPHQSGPRRGRTALLRVPRW
jgi:hypothetical protein